MPYPPHRIVGAVLALLLFQAPLAAAPGDDCRACLAAPPGTLCETHEHALARDLRKLDRRWDAEESGAARIQLLEEAAALPATYSGRWTGALAALVVRGAAANEATVRRRSLELLGGCDEQALVLGALRDSFDELTRRYLAAEDALRQLEQRPPPGTAAQAREREAEWYALRLRSALAAASLYELMGAIGERDPAQGAERAVALHVLVAEAYPLTAIECTEAIGAWGDARDVALLVRSFALVEQVVQDCEREFRSLDAMAQIADLMDEDWKRTHKAASASLERARQGRAALDEHLRALVERERLPPPEPPGDPAELAATWRKWLERQELPAGR